MTDKEPDDGTWIVGLLMAAPYYLIAACVGAGIGVVLFGPGLFNVVTIGIALYAMHQFLVKH